MLQTINEIFGLTLQAREVMFLASIGISLAFSVAKSNP